MSTQLQVDVSVYQGNIKVDVEYLALYGEGIPGSEITKFVKNAEKAGKDIEAALVKLPFDVGIGDVRGEGFNTKGGLVYQKTIFVDLSVDREDLMGLTGDAFLEAFKGVVSSMGGTLTNNGRRVAREKDEELRKKLIRLAAEREDLRPDLLPLLGKPRAKQAMTANDWIQQIDDHVWDMDRDVRGYVDRIDDSFAMLEEELYDEGNMREAKMTTDFSMKWRRQVQGIFDAWRKFEKVLARRR